MSEIGKILIFLGAFMIIIGALIFFMGRVGFLGQLPGDFVLRKRNVTIVFPLATSILLSIILSVIFYLARFFRK